MRVNVYHEEWLHFDHLLWAEIWQQQIQWEPIVREMQWRQQQQETAVASSAMLAMLFGPTEKHDAS